MGLFVSKTTHINIRIPAYQPLEEEKPATPKQATMVGARGNSIGRRYVPSAPPHGTPSPSFSSSPPYVPSLFCLHRVLVSLALRSHNNSNRNNRTFAGASRRCRPQCHYSLSPCFSTIPPPLEIRFNCPKHPSRNLGGLPSSWMLGGAHIDFTAPDLDQLWMLIHNTDPTQANPPHQCPSNSF